MKRNIKAGKRYGRGLEFNVFTTDELNDIHDATLEVLQKTGVFVEDSTARDIFASGGAMVDAKAKVVRIPAHLVGDAVRSAPEVVLLAGRNPENDILLEINRVGFDCFGEAIQIIDPQTREIREPTKADLADATRLVDALEHIDICHRSLGCHDVHPAVAAIHNAEAILSNTSKHVFLAVGSGRMLRQVKQMIAAIVGGEDKIPERPILSCGTCPVTPLRLPQDCCEIVMETAGSGMVTKCLSQAMAGGSSPVTLAGTLVLHNAEVLSTCVLSQLVRKGAPFVYGSSTCGMDLRFGTAVVGNPETALLNAAIAQISRNYKLPCQVAGG